ncbi:dual specificity protein phosphatase family protein [Candidatus Protochlamydia sp. W-9]|uniref:dual specificity protein phosphatase family protein n=1 Tax=Candidatus Protochlamydia sp. W-9 TaxID=1785087 RepID=UPI00096A9994|nr:dual specificity protein phosphatase [Candidatus Protochlamydia sp. W-9]
MLISSFSVNTLEDLPNTRDVESQKQCPEIVTNLFLSSVVEAENLSLLQKKKITHILNLTGTIKGQNEARYPNKFIQSFTYKHLMIPDEMDTNISQHFVELHQFIKEGTIGKHKVLVHCEAGISRSSAVVISYLMKEHSLNLKDAYIHVRSKKENIGPNQSFFQQLINYEEFLFNTHSYSMMEYLTDQLLTGAAAGFSKNAIQNALKKANMDINLAIANLFSF